MSTPDGLKVIDWANARRGDPATDVANTWSLLVCGEAPGGSFDRAAAAIGRGLLLRTFLRSLDRAAAQRAMPALVEWRLRDRNHTEAELSGCGASSSDRRDRQTRPSALPFSERFALPGDADRSETDGRRGRRALTDRRGPRRGAAPGRGRSARPRATTSTPRAARWCRRGAALRRSRTRFSAGRRTAATIR